jgi:hypothetical protein
LLAGVVAAHLPLVDEVLADRFGELVRGLSKGMRTPPRALRYRIQTDLVGLDRSEHGLMLEGEMPILEIDLHGPPLPQVVGTLAALNGLRGQRRRIALRLVRMSRSIEWTSGREVAARLLAGADPEVLSVRRDQVGEREERALATLGFGVWERPTRAQVTAAFRRLVRGVHPDHGAESAGAGVRVAELAAARQLLLDDPRY